MFEVSSSLFQGGVESVERDQLSITQLLGLNSYLRAKDRGRQRVLRAEGQEEACCGGSMITVFFYWTHCALSAVTIETIIYTAVRNRVAVKLQCGLSLMIFTHADSVRLCMCACGRAHVLAWEIKLLFRALKCRKEIDSVKSWCYLFEINRIHFCFFSKNTLTNLKG